MLRNVMKQVGDTAPAFLMRDAWKFGVSSEVVKGLGGMPAYVVLVAALPFLALLLRLSDIAGGGALAAILLIFLKGFEQQILFAAKTSLAGEQKERVVSGIAFLSLASMFAAFVTWFAVSGLMEGSL